VTETNTRPPDLREEFRVRGGQLIDRVKELVAEGNVRLVVIKHDDQTLVEIPLTVGVIGSLLLPQVAAIGAIAALLTECTIEIVRAPTP
jgi:hypothetical protein